MTTKINCNKCGKELTFSEVEADSGLCDHCEFLLDMDTKYCSQECKDTGNCDMSC